MGWRSLDKWQGLINNDFLAEATIILVRANVIRDTLEVISNLGMKSVIYQSFLSFHSALF